MEYDEHDLRQSPLYKDFFKPKKPIKIRSHHSFNKSHLYKCQVYFRQTNTIATTLQFLKQGEQQVKATRHVQSRSKYTAGRIN